MAGGADASDGTRNFFALARYNPDGSLDNSFDTDGKLTTAISSTGDSARGVRVQLDGKIVAAGGADNDFGLARYNTDGSLDTSFDMDGKVQSDFGSGTEVAEAVAIGPDGKIVLAGSSWTTSNMLVARYCP